MMNIIKGRNECHECAEFDDYFVEIAVDCYRTRLCQSCLAEALARLREVILEASKASKCWLCGAESAEGCMEDRSCPKSR